MSVIVVPSKTPSAMRRKALERGFPIQQISGLAEHESWRKEVHRPLYHIHKWWAQRLGSVFRALILGALADEDIDIWDSFYERHNFADKVILDPFMGSGTTLGECAKLGAKPVGIDINPVSSFIVRQSLTNVSVTQLEAEYRAIEADVKEIIGSYYQTLDPQTQQTVPVLYYFWVKQVTLPDGEVLPLFSSFIFSKNAYPTRKPTAQIICPRCWNISSGRFDAIDLTCSTCGNQFNPQAGFVKGQYIIATNGKQHKIKDLIAATDQPPAHRLYAVMALNANGAKVYQTPTKYDFDLLAKASSVLQKEELPLPDMPLRAGHNTNQAKGYNYNNWRDFFNDRQLLCLGLLLRRILRISDKALREQFICLFSSALEFNNLFCTFKGEGTGAVRPLFSHHILKPERTPLENSVWGTGKSSGTFCTLFRSRLLKAKQYLEDPTEIQIVRSLNGEGTNGGSRRIICNAPLNLQITGTWEEFAIKDKAALVLNGDGGNLPLPDESVDAVITDPPYFDFVHYSELSDFFFAWLKPALRGEYSYFVGPDSSRPTEVQDKDANKFTDKLTSVFHECFRVLKENSILAFSFHHSRPKGWLSIYQALTNAGFYIVKAYPIHGEMKAASPKSATKDPISLDAILVCKKLAHKVTTNQDIMPEIESRTAKLTQELRAAGVTLSQADLFVIRMSQAMSLGSLTNRSATSMKKLLEECAVSIN
jgi:putative DNA methylase